MKHILLLVITIFIFSSCSPRLTPFSDQLTREMQWGEDELSKIQYYLSDDIVLWRNLSRTEDSKIEGGKIKLKNGKKIEEIVFLKSTPGVLIEKLSNNNLGIGFEANNDKYLTFRPSKRSGTYMLMATNFKNGIGKVAYDDKIWNVYEENSVGILEVDLRNIRERKIKSRTAKGRTVN